MSAMAELHADIQRIERLTPTGPLKVNGRGEDAVRAALRGVIHRAMDVGDEPDLLEMLKGLTAVRDACIAAAITIKAVVDETRDAAIKQVGKAA